MAVNVASGSRTFTIAWRAALATFVILVVLTSFGVFLGGGYSDKPNRGVSNNDVRPNIGKSSRRSGA